MLTPAERILAANEDTLEQSANPTPPLPELPCRHRLRLQAFAVIADGTATNRSGLVLGVEARSAIRRVLSAEHERAPLED